MFLKTLDEKQKNNLKNLNGILKNLSALRFTWQKGPWFMNPKWGKIEEKKEEKYMTETMEIHCKLQKGKINRYI